MLTDFTNAQGLKIITGWKDLLPKMIGKLVTTMIIYSYSTNSRIVIVYILLYIITIIHYISYIFLYISIINLLIYIYIYILGFMMVILQWI